jgi:hypothetical protein
LRKEQKLHPLLAEVSSFLKRGTLIYQVEADGYRRESVTFCSRSTLGTQPGKRKAKQSWHLANSSLAGLCGDKGMALHPRAGL